MALNSNDRFVCALGLFFCFFLCLVISIGTTYGANSATLDGWLLTQRHKQLGQNYVYLTHDAVKIVNKTLGFTILLGPPFKSIAIYRPDDRVIFTSNPQDFQKTSFLSSIIATKPFRYQSLVQYGEEDFHGLHVAKFASKKDEHEQIWTITNVPLSPSILAVVHTYYQIGFKKLENAGQAFVSKQGANGLSDIIKDLDIGEDLGKQEGGKPNTGKPDESKHETDVKKPTADKKRDTGKK